MKTVAFKFIIELPDGEEIISEEHEYTYIDDKQNLSVEEIEEQYDTYNDVLYDSYEDMREEVEQDKVKFIFDTLSIKYEQINK